MKTKIQLLIKNFIESTTNIATLSSRTLFVREHINEIISLTNFLPENSKTNERLYIIHNNLAEKDLKCPMCDNKRKFYTFTNGYNLCCSKSCATKYQQKYLITNKEEIYKLRTLNNSLKPDHIKQAEIDKRIKTTIERYGEDAFSIIGRKSYNTQVEKGTYIPIAHYIMNNLPDIHIEMHLKAAQTMLNDIDENGNNFYQRLTNKMYEIGRWVRPENKQDLEHYRIKVGWVMNKFKNNIRNLDNYDKRGHIKYKDDAYHLDHKFSVIEGFLQNIPPHFIGNINNLEMISAHNNFVKNRKCSITKDELINSILINSEMSIN